MVDEPLDVRGSLLHVPLCSPCCSSLTAAFMSKDRCTALCGGSNVSWQRCDGFGLRITLLFCFGGGLLPSDVWPLMFGTNSAVLYLCCWIILCCCGRSRRLMELRIMVP